MRKHFLFATTAMIACAFGCAAVADILDDNAAEVQVGVTIQVPETLEVTSNIEFGTLLVDATKMSAAESVTLAVDSDELDMSAATNIDDRGGSQRGGVCVPISQAQFEGSADIPAYELEILDEEVTLTNEDSEAELTFVAEADEGAAMSDEDDYGFCWALGGTLTIPANVDAGRYDGTLHVSAILEGSSGSGKVDYHLVPHTPH